MENSQEYLKPTPVIDSDSKSIVEKAQELTGGMDDATGKAKSLFYFVRDEIKYTIYVDIELAENYRASKVMRDGQGYCVMKATLLTALARAAGIPARLAFADLTNHTMPQKYIEMQGNNHIIYHGFAEVYLNERWTKLTPSFDIKMCNKYGIVPSDFDGEEDAMLHPKTRQGYPFVEYIKFHGSFADLPHAEILEATRQGYGQDFLELWKKHAQLDPTTRPSSDMPDTGSPS